MRLYEIYDSLDEGYKEVAIKFNNETGDTDLVSSYIKKFRDMHQRNMLSGQEKDINIWGKHGFNKFRKFVDSLSVVPSRNEVRKATSHGNALELVNTDQFLVVVPFDLDASAFYGRGTDWCTTKQNQSHFSNYFFKNGITLVYLINKNTDNKWAVATHEKLDKVEIFDKSDTAISEEQLHEETGFSINQILNMVNKNKDMIHAGRERNKALDITYMVDNAISTGQRDIALEKILQRKRNIFALLQYRDKFPDVDFKIPDAYNRASFDSDSGDIVFKNKNGELHREDGPAVMWENGTKEWWIHDQLHREDGPAIEWADGSKEWCIHNRLHREDGPAVEESNGHKAWYIRGRNVSSWNEFQHEAKLSDTQIQQLKQQYGENALRA